MSHLKFFAYEGQGVEKQQKFSYSQAVRVGDWDPITGEFEKEINAQIGLAFENVERCLKDAGGKG
ncbi:hypothetical protein CGCVW01_v006986 [Colletotrichum viniferum]|nr:hypothetical protein CGCVW01_v006986 [Colletotrichum viniferum]